MGFKLVLPLLLLLIALRLSQSQDTAALILGGYFDPEGEDVTSLEVIFV